MHFPIETVRFLKPFSGEQVKNDLDVTIAQLPPQRYSRFILDAEQVHLDYGSDACYNE